MPAGKLDVFNLGELGVNTVKSPLHQADGDLLQAQNAMPDPAGLEGGIRKRDGMAKVNTVAMVGAVQGIINVPLPDIVVGEKVWIYAALDPAQELPWSGGDHEVSGLNGLVALRPPEGPGAVTIRGPAAFRDFAKMTAFSASGARQYRGSLIASLNGRIFYPSNVYTAGTDAPPIHAFTGTSDAVLARIPEWYDSGTKTQAQAIISIIEHNDLLYVSTFDGGSGANLQGRVFELNPETGALRLIGSPFGNQSGETAGGMPFAMTFWQGRLWVGTFGGAATSTGLVYWIRPGIDEDWTLDHTTAAGQGYITAMSAYGGNLYVGTNGDAGLAALVLRRTPAAVWSTSDMGLQTAAENRYNFLIEFENNLYAYYFLHDQVGPTYTNKQVIRKFDGTSWTTDYDPYTDAAWPASSGTVQGVMALIVEDVLYVGTGADTADDGRGGIWNLKGIVWTGVDAGGSASYLGQIASETALVT